MKSFYSTLILSMLVCCCLAQTSAPPVDLINVRTIAPEAASLGKFGNIPVSLATGIASVSIPIHNITLGAVNIPVSLDYHSGGIQVDEVASCVGIGWALAGNGVISRNVIGLPDEISTGTSYINGPEAIDVVHGGGSSNSTYRQYLFEIHQNLSDAEPDIFQYNFCGQSGKFIFKHDGTVMQIPATNNKIIYSGGNFHITDVNGVQYIFDLKLMSGSASQGVNTDYNTQWQLTKIIDKNTIDTIFISYESTCNLTMEQTTTALYTVGMIGGECGMTIIDDQVLQYFSPETGARGVDYYTNNYHYDAYVKEIKWRGGKISFITKCDRQDVVGSARRLDSVIIYSELNANYLPVKQYKLHQSYFFSNPTAKPVTERNYRLRLDSVSQLPINTTDQSAVHRMDYYDIAMPPRESLIMDKWGYNNGKFSQAGSMQTQSIFYNGVYYQYGSANRTSDSMYMQTYSLKSIVYPTKGKSQFQYEPHQYLTNFSKRINNAASCNVYGGVQRNATTMFTTGPHSAGFICTPYISKTNTNQLFDGRPSIYIYDQATNQLIWNHEETPANTGQEGTAYSPGTMSLNYCLPNHSYRIEINIHTDNPNVNASMIVSWVDSIPPTPEVVTGGGQRVKNITNYDLNGRFLNRRKFEYGNNGEGVILTPQYYQDINFEKVVHRVGCWGGGMEGFCVEHFENQENNNPFGYSLLYHSYSIYPTTQFTGSPVLYRKVTEYEVDSLDYPNGKTAHFYQVYQDGSTISNNGINDPLPVEYFVNGVYLISNNWKNGFKTGEDIYKYLPGIHGPGQYKLKERKRTQYLALNENQQNILKIKPTYRSSGCEEVITYSAICYSVPVTTGAMVPVNETDTIYDDYGNILGSFMDKGFNTDLLPIATMTVKSNGDTAFESIKYPKDFASTGNVYQKMVSRNILSPSVQAEKFINSRSINKITRNYIDFAGDSKLLLPTSLEIKNNNYPSEVRARFNQYDLYGNITQQQKDSDVYQAVIWDYRSTLPIAKAFNAAATDIAFTSFEAEGNGGWSNIIPGNILNGATITGNKYYSLTTAGLTKSALSSGNTYIISYWSRNGAYTVAGTSPTKTGQSITRGGITWVYYEHQVSGQTSISISGTGGIDELRLYPSAAQMETFTYIPGIGISSKTDTRDQTTYFEYDGLGRLKFVRDKDNNIINHTQYRFVQ